MIVLLLAGVVVWILYRRGAFARSPLPTDAILPPAEPEGSWFGKLCNQVTQTGGAAAMAAPDVRAQAAGVLAKTLGPVACAIHEKVLGYAWDGTKWVASKSWDGTEYVADKTWDGTKWVAGKTASGAKAVGSGTVTAVKAVGSGVATGAKAVGSGTVTGVKAVGSAGRAVVTAPVKLLRSIF